MHRPQSEDSAANPYTSLDDLGRDGQKRFEPALFSLMYGLGSNSDPT